MEPTNFRDLDERIQWAVCCLLKSGEAKTAGEHAEKNGGVMVECKINGVEVDFIRLVNSLKEHHQWYVDRAAKEMVLERMNEMDTEFYNLFRTFKQGVKEKFPNLDWEDR